MNKIDEYNIKKDIKAAKFNIIFGIIFTIVGITIKMFFRYDINNVMFWYLN